MVKESLINVQPIREHVSHFCHINPKTFLSLLSYFLFLPLYILWRAESNEDTQRLLSICKYELWNIEVNILSVSVCSLMNVDNILKVLTEGVRWKQFVKFSLTMNKGANILFQM